MNKKNRRPQVSKRTAHHQRFVEDLRQGSRTSPHASPKDYRRKPKHTGKGWEQ